jgi:transcriptional regulator with XRE-family HTH domain
MTLKQLANEAGCTHAYLSQLERGLANPSVTILKKVASALRMKVVVFFIEPGIAENDVVMRERERVNINFKEGEAKIQMLVRNIHDERMQPFMRRLNPGARAS